MPRAPMSDVIVLLPGITGSALRKDGKVVWGFSGKAIGSALFTRGKAMREKLMLRDDDPAVDDLGDGVTAKELIPDLHLLPGLWKIDGYTRVAKVIQDRFDVREGENFILFAYDWRRDNRYSARRLQRESHAWLKRWREKSGNPDAKLILVGHSMGGLISRWFIECLEGWKDTRALITFGTPHRGSLNAVDTLANGMRKGPFGLMDLTDLSRSFTALYQLLPIYPCIDPGDGTLHRVAETDVPNIDRTRAADALAFHRGIESAIETNMQDPAYARSRYRIHPIVGLAQKTNQSARLRDGGVDMLQSLGGRDLAGDGTVPRVSATPIELSDKGMEMFAAAQHGSIQNMDVVLTQLEGIITGLSVDLSQFRAPERAVALEVEDIYFDDEPVVMRARAMDSQGGAVTDTRIRADLRDATTDEVVRAIEFVEAEDGWSMAKLSPLPAGAWRVQITTAGLPSVEDAFAVAERA
jgi:pimeloyl-ACP methyl ester carboxylesterase